VNEFTKDNWLNFVIDHYKDIEAINEIYGMAQKKLPEQVNLAITNSILELGKSFFSLEDIECETDKDGTFWYDTNLYNKKEEVGPYFGFENSVEWGNLLPEGNRNSARLVASYNPSGKKKAGKKDLDKWITKFGKHKSSLIKKQIMIKPDDEDPEYLAAYYLHNEVNIEVLKTQGELRKRVQKAVKEFTSAILPIMRKMAKA